MKRMILCALVLLATATAADAQATRKKTTARKTTPARMAMRPKAPAPVVSAVSTGNYTARSGAVATRFSIADPTINALNLRANGGDARVSNSGIVGMPKRAYGFANGKLILNSSGSTTSGTMTGSGAVGTGSSLGSIGSTGPAIGLNGKSPYAGSAMWGNARRMTLNYGDASVRLARGRRD